MRDESEAKRLARVYRYYREDAATQARWSRHNPGNRYILEERQRVTKRLLQVHRFLPLAGCHALEVGCGSGDTLAFLQGFGAQPGNLWGVDLLPDRITEANRLIAGYFRSWTLS